MTNLTDEQRLAEAVAELEREHRISDGDGLCHWCGDPPPCPTLRVILELRELRAENVQLRARNEYLERDGGSLAQRELSKHYESEMHLATADNERLRAALTEVRAMYVGKPHQADCLAYLEADYGVDYECSCGQSASVKDGDA